MPKQEFFFNTGVQPENAATGPKIPLMKNQYWATAVDGGLVKVIRFYADVPEGSTFMFASSHGDLPKDADVVVAELSEGLECKFGYFRLKKEV